MMGPGWCPGRGWASMRATHGTTAGVLPSDSKTYVDLTLRLSYAKLRGEHGAIPATSHLLVGTRVGLLDRIRPSRYVS